MQIGGLVGAYQVIAKLGVGGMGEVYRARDTRLERRVAIKVLPAVLVADPRSKGSTPTRGRTSLYRREREVRVLGGRPEPADRPA